MAVENHRASDQKRFLSQNVRSLSCIAPYQAVLLSKKSVWTYGDLLHYYPVRYEDRTSILSISEAAEKALITEGFIGTIICQCVRAGSFSYHRRRIKRFVFVDGRSQGRLGISAFDPKHSYFKVDRYYMLSGKLKVKYRTLQMNLLDYEPFDKEAVDSLHMGRIVPIYASTERLTQKTLRAAIKHLLDLWDGADVGYGLPQEAIDQYRLTNRKHDVHEMHFPSSYEALERSRNKLVYEEFFWFQYRLVEKKITNKLGKEFSRYSKSIPECRSIERLKQSLGFSLTDDQNQAIRDIISDMTSPFVMVRLLQGDVGCGKTLVAMITMLYSYENEHQAAMMVPTDILARQHYETFEQHLGDLIPRGHLCLLTNTVSAEERQNALMRLKSEKSLLVIGTHALIQESVEFLDLKYIVIDEQHKFGVEQRKALQQKGQRADILQMSATPIPRSLAMTVFGDMDMTVIRHLPHQNTRRHTEVIEELNRHQAYEYLLERVKAGEQGYVVFPVIDPVTGVNKRSLMQEFNALKERFFKGIPITVIHGKTPLEEREKLLRDFQKGTIKVLFATTVIEVGVHYPNATVLIIESAHQFGLSQLHQLRGRIGRTGQKSLCYLLAASERTEAATLRMHEFAKITDGFHLAEIDLTMRGSGDFLGQKQSGIPQFKLGDIVKDVRLLRKARQDAETYLAKKMF